MSDVTIRISAVDNASQTLRNVSSALGGVSTAAVGPTGQSGVSKAIGMATTALGAFGVVVGTTQLIRLAGEMRDLGEKAASTERAFLNLNGGTREAAATLGAMRTATRGVVEDIDLMAGANRLLLMGLASNTQEVSKLTEIAVTLGRVMGKDASQAVEDFSLLLANRSILRLDNFGISAANVRARIEELKEAGYGVEEAFRLAVLAEGEVALGKVGDAAAVAATAWDALAVKISNVKTELAGVVFQLGELAATVLLNPMDTFDTSEPFTGGVDIAEGRTLVQQVDAILAERFQGQFTEHDADAMTAAIMQVEAGNYADIRAAGYAVGLDEGQFRALEVVYAATSGRTLPGGFGAPITPTTGMPLPGMQAQRGAMEQAERAARQAQYATSAAGIQGMYGMSTIGQTTPETRAATAHLIGAQTTRERQQQVAFENQYGRGGVGGWYGIQANDRESGLSGGMTVQELRDGARELLSNVVGRVVEIGGNFITSAGRIRDAMDEAAAAAARIPATLNEWLAKDKPTGIAGDFLTQVGREMKQISDSDTAEQEFLAGTGMRSWRDDLITMIAGMPMEQAVPVATRMSELLAAGGEDYSSIAEAMGGAGYYYNRNAGGGGGGGGGGTTRYTVKPGDTVSGLAAQFGMSQDAIMARFGISDPRTLRAGATASFGSGGGGGGLPGVEGWQQYDTTMIGSMLAGGGGGGGVDVESNGMVAAIDEASARLADFDGQASDVIERPRTMPIDLSFVADLLSLSPILRPIVEQIMAGMERSAAVGTGNGVARTLPGGKKVR